MLAVFMLPVTIRSVMLRVVIMLDVIVLSVVMLMAKAPSLSATKKKVFFFSKLEPAEKVIKGFCPQFTNFSNKLEYLSLASISNLV